MGAGPLHLVRHLGVEAEEIVPASEWRSEIKTSFELYRGLAGRLASADEFPVVLSGHCGASIGAAAGLGADAILWFDAHGDYNTPDTTDTGFLDGMCLAVATGRCWRGLARTIPGFAPIDPRRVIHVGARDWSPGEREALLNDGVHLVDPRTAAAPSNGAAPGTAAAQCGAAAPAAVPPAPLRPFDTIAPGRLLVHVDLDVIDSRYGRANPFACEGGPSPDEVLRVIDTARERFTIAGLVLASYDPSCDADGRIADTAARIVDAFC